MNNKNNNSKFSLSIVARTEIMYFVIVFVIIIFGIRLFYLQIIRHEYYKKSALVGQLKEYQIPANRGIIEAYDNNKTVPIVLNEKKYLLFADPKYIKNPEETSYKIHSLIGGNQKDILKKLKLDTRYSVLAKKLSLSQKNKLDSLNLKGVGTREEYVRTYPQGSLAAQLLGFVDDEGVGKYGLEQALNTKLSGVPGELKAITDVNGVPLVANTDNIINNPKNGDRILLTLDVNMQKQLEDVLKSGLDRAKSKSGSAVILDPNSGEIKAMANYPSYDPAAFYKVEDASLFNNNVVTSPLEVGSIMKPLTAAAALDTGAVSENSSYYDPSFYKIGDAKVTNIEEDGGAGTRSVADILELSLNTGATWLLMQMGGGSINQKAREAWHGYMNDHYRFGTKTGIEQGYEETGSVPDPNEGYGLNIVYANTSFGQGMTATPLQMGAALCAVINGGKYYRPHLVDSVTHDYKTSVNKPVVLNDKVVRPEVSRSIIRLMEGVVNKNHKLYGMQDLNTNYSIGGKTGTAEITKPGGGYYTDKFNGMFMGFLGGDKPEYVIVIRVNEPAIKGYAGSKAAAPIFTDVTNMLINNFNVNPKTN